MAEAADFSLNMEQEHDLEEESPRYSYREGVIFIIDAAEPMFEIDPKTETSYFAQCLETYKSILSDKLSWNKTDWMSIVLMGTNKWDDDPEIENILTWIKFGEVSIEQMMTIERALENVDKVRTEIGSSSTFPLYDAMWYAQRSFGAVKVQMPYRDVVLLTRTDNPFSDVPSERYRLMLKAGDYKTSHVRLTVVGLGKEWSEKHFFQELELKTRKSEKAEDYRRTFLADLEEEVKHSCRITSKVHWTIGGNVKLGVALSSITAKSKFPRKVFLKKENNELLDGYSYLKKADDTYIESEEDDDEDGKEKKEEMVLPSKVYKYQSFGGRDIKFTLQEAAKLGVVGQRGIKLIGFMKQSKLDVSHHLEAPKFVTYDESELEGSKALFAALLDRTNRKKVMAICAVTLRSAAYVCAMIPAMERGGFYAYKLPFEENVRDFSSVFPEYVYNETDNKPPIDEAITSLSYKFMKKTSMAYNPTMFQNPKLRAELANNESLAMEKDIADIPIDTTIPDKAIAHGRLGELKDRFEEAVRVHCVKRPGEVSSSGLNFQELVEDRRVEKCTVQQLRDYLRSVGANPVGRKADLVNMVYSLFK